MLEGADWGEPQEVKLIDVDGPALLLRWDYQQMGYYGAGYNLFRLGQSRIEPLAQFPSLRSNGGTSENLIYEVRLAGAELSGDRRRVILRYVGHLTNQATGGVRTIEDEQTVTLDGTHDAWIENWGIESW